MLPSCNSDQMLNVAYRLKTTLVLHDPHGQQRSANTSSCSFSHQLPFRIGYAMTTNESTLDLIQKSKFPAVRVHRTASDHFTMRAALSNTITHEGEQLDTKIRIDSTTHEKNSNPKLISRISGTIVQVIVQENCLNESLDLRFPWTQACEVQEGEIVEKKVDAFNIQLDRKLGKTCDETKCSEELTVPFCLPDSLLPTLIQKDQRAKLCYHVKVYVIVDSYITIVLNVCFNISGRVLLRQKARVKHKSATHRSRPVEEQIANWISSKFYDVSALILASRHPSLILAVCIYSSTPRAIWTGRHSEESGIASLSASEFRPLASSSQYVLQVLSNLVAYFYVNRLSICSLLPFPCARSTVCFESLVPVNRSDVNALSRFEYLKEINAHAGRCER